MGSHVPFCHSGPFGGGSPILLGRGPMSFWGPMSPPVPLGCLTSFWGGSCVYLGVPHPLLSLWSLWGAPTSLCGGIPCFFWGPMSPPVPLGCPSSLWGGSQVSSGVPCPFGGILCPLLILWSLWGVPHPFRGGPMSFWGSHIPSCLSGPFVADSTSLWGSHVPPCPFGVSHIPLGVVLCPFWGPMSPPVP